jgi:hypothetical protein
VRREGTAGRTVEPVDLSNLSAFVVASEKGHFIWVSSRGDTTVRDYTESMDGQD